MWIINPIIATLVSLYFIMVSVDKNIHSTVFHIILGGILFIVGIKFFSPIKTYNLLLQDILYIHNYQLNQAIKLILHNYLNVESVIPLILPIGVILIIYGVLKYRKNRKQLTNDFITASNKTSDSQNTDYNDSICFGTKYNYDEGIAITDKELNQHTLVIGTTGSGKTTTLMNIVDSCCKRNLPLIYVDGKGSIKLANKINEICKKYNRRLKVFSLDPHILNLNEYSNIPNISCYNPLAFGNFTEWKNKIITLTQEAEGKGQEHYSLQEQSYISLVCEILNKSGAYVDLEGLIAYIKDPAELQKIANRISPELGMRLVKISKETDESDIIKVLEAFYYS
ncbi:MAG: DUF853 family protein, partial [Burkholderiales bacterium]|nr:DUF853 family protein [Burkholderiales bacterium]